MEEKLAVAAETEETTKKTEITRPDALARVAEAVRIDAEVDPAKFVSDAVVPKGGE